MTRAPASAAEKTQSAAITAEFAMTDADFRQIAEMLHADAGIHLPEAKAALVYARLAKRMRALGQGAFATIAISSPARTGATNASRCWPR